MDQHPCVRAGLVGNSSGQFSIPGLATGVYSMPADIEINGPLFTRVELRIKKLFPFLSRGSIEVNLEMLNALNNINFSHNLTPGEGAGTFQVTSSYRDANTTQDPGGRIGQVVFRINWQIVAGWFVGPGGDLSSSGLFPLNSAETLAKTT